ncbi:FGGY family carbohydrate kinase, partial [Robiginitalea sp.]|uniref:FGGY family carbohydrate kinase n=1 Tax=Robiginitalea sp. TaxID=1902411 RepID=UPI003C3F5542
MFFIGYDLGSSSLKTALVDTQTGESIAVIKTPAEELAIDAPRVGWAEQDPELWWRCICEGTRELLSNTGVSSEDISGIGIAYQMHGLVTLDKAGRSVRPAIIWCDSRAVSIGDQTLEEVGATRCQAQ